MSSRIKKEIPVEYVQVVKDEVDNMIVSISYDFLW